MPDLFQTVCPDPEPLAAGVAHGVAKRNATNDGWESVERFALVQQALAAASSAVGFNAQAIEDIAAPVNPQDACTKAYADAIAAGAAPAGAAYLVDTAVADPLLPAAVLGRALVSTLLLGLGDANPASVEDVLRLEHRVNAAFGANGIGAGLVFRNENTAGALVDAGRIAGVFVDATGGAELGALDFYALSCGAGAAQMRLTSAGALLLGAAAPLGTELLRVVGDARVEGGATVASDLVVGGNLTVQGDSFVTEAEHVQYADNHLYLNADYTTAAGQTGGLVVNYLPTATADTVAAPGFAAGVPGVSNPTVRTVGAATFAVGDVIQISGAALPDNDGLFEVLSHAANVLTIRGIGTSATTQDWVQNQFAATAAVAGAITKVGVSVLRAGSDGRWEVGVGNTTAAWAFGDLFTAGTPSADGQVPIGSGAGGLALATITGTANRVSVVNGPNSITLSAPQDLHTAATPTFGALLMAVGTAAAPSYAWTGGAGFGDKGWYSSGSGTFDATVGGVARLRVSSATLMPITDNAMTCGTATTAWSAVRTRLVTGTTPVSGAGSELRLRGSDAGGAGPFAGGDLVFELGAGVGAANGNLLVRDAADAVSLLSLTDAGAFAFTATTWNVTATGAITVAFPAASWATFNVGAVPYLQLLSTAGGEIASLGYGAFPATMRFTLGAAAADAESGTTISSAARVITNGASGRSVLMDPYVAEGGGGNHPLLAGLWIAALKVTAGAATVSDATTFYVAGPSNAVVSGTNYTGWIDGTLRLGGQLFGIAGTNAAPSWSFDLDRDTGIINGAANRMDFITAGDVVPRFEIDDNETAAETALLLSIAGAAVSRVSVGANDSGGGGFRVLRVPN